MPKRNINVRYQQANLSLRFPGSLHSSWDKQESDKLAISPADRVPGQTETSGFVSIFLSKADRNFRVVICNINASCTCTSEIPCRSALNIFFSNMGRHYMGGRGSFPFLPISADFSSVGFLATHCVPSYYHFLWITGFGEKATRHAAIVGLGGAPAGRGLDMSSL